jgi:hypothetical protein
VTAQGHETTKADGGRVVVRRPVLVGSVGALVVGLALALSGLPALALSSGSHPAVVAASTRPTTPTTPSTTVASAVTRHATVSAPAQRHVAASSAPSGARTTAATAATPTAHPSAPAAAPTPARTTAPRHVPVTTTPAAPVPSVALRLSANIVPSPNFLQAGSGQIVNGQAVFENPCVTPQATWPAVTADPSCTAYVLQVINNARAVEGVKAMVLPSNWSSLTTPEQLFVVADLERVDRGLAPYLGLNATLNSAAQSAAQHRDDPGAASGFAVATNAQGMAAWTGAWGSGYSVLVADYMWMYDDGWGGSHAATANVACTSAGAAGCWGHRAELLGSDPGYNPGPGLGCTTCVMGAGFAVVGGSGSYADLIEEPAGALPAMTFTWTKDVEPYL